MPKYIDSEALKRDLIDNRNFYPAIVANAIEHAPACDVVEIVRCKDCKYSRELKKDEKIGLSEGILICKSQIATNNGMHPVWSNYFCGCGKRKEDVK